MIEELWNRLFSNLEIIEVIIVIIIVEIENKKNISKSWDLLMLKKLKKRI